MSFRNKVRLSLFLSVLVIACFAGCSTVDKAKDWVTGPEKIYLKKIAIEGIANRTYVRTAEMNQYTRSLDVKLTEIIRNDPWLKVMDRDALAILSGASIVSEDHKSIMAFGRKWGVSAFLKAAFPS